MLLTRFAFPSTEARTLRLTAASALCLCLLTHTALAATPASPVRPPVPSNTQGTPAQSAALPMPDSVALQAEEQADGFFGTLVRPRTPGQIQEAWDRLKPEEAVYETEMCGSCTYKVRTREFMVTVIELPRGEEILSADLGDNGGFSVQPRGTNRLAVRPVGHGYDTSLIVYGKSGKLYPFYLRAEGFNAMTAPDLVVRIAGAVTVTEGLAVPGFTTSSASSSTSSSASSASSASGETPVPEGLAGGKAGASGQTGARGIVAGLTETAPGTPDGDFAASAPFDPSKLRGWGDYRLRGDRKLRPETVFRDDHFTYIRFGKRWQEIELPTAYVVVDGIDELVNTRVQGSTYIIESTQPLITLKSGQSFLCIEYEGEV